MTYYVVHPVINFFDTFQYQKVLQVHNVNNFSLICQLIKITRVDMQARVVNFSCYLNLINCKFLEVKKV